MVTKIQGKLCKVDTVRVCVFACVHVAIQTRWSCRGLLQMCSAVGFTLKPLCIMLATSRDLQVM